MQCHWNLFFSKRYAFTDHQNRSDFSRSHTREYLPPKIHKTHPKYKLYKCTLHRELQTVMPTKLLFVIPATGSSKNRHGAIYMYFKTEYNSTKIYTTPPQCQTLVNFSSFLSLPLSSHTLNKFNLSCWLLQSSDGDQKNKCQLCKEELWEMTEV